MDYKLKMTLLSNIKNYFDIIFTIPRSKRLGHSFKRINKKIIKTDDLSIIDKKYYSAFIAYYNIFHCHKCGIYLLQDDLFRGDSMCVLDNLSSKNILKYIFRYRILTANNYYSCSEHIIKSLIQ